MKRIATVCARGGSKGVKNKNTRNFLGKPLLVHTIDIIKNSKLFDVIAVSSDSEEILTLASHHVDNLIKRPAYLATDTSAKLPAIQHCVFEVEEILQTKFATIVDIAVTSPLLLPEDIIGAVQFLENSQNALNVITGSVADNSPYFSLVEKQANGFVQLAKKSDQSFACRQECPLTYDMNGAVYVWKAQDFFNLKEVITEKTLIYEMPRERSIDIDTEFDFDLAKYLYKKNSYKTE